jgi:hypothetical protein
MNETQLQILADTDGSAIPADNLAVDDKISINFDFLKAGGL